MHCYSDDRGASLMSVFDHLPEIPGQVNASSMYPGVVKAWHRHRKQDDHWVVLHGMLKIGLFNTGDSVARAELRLAGRRLGDELVETLEIAAGAGRAVFLGERAMGSLRIPAGLWHGAVAVGGRPAMLLYYVTRRYDPQDPDEERADWDAFDFSWKAEQR